MNKKSHKVLITISIIILLIGEVVGIFVVLPNGCDAVLDFMFGAKYDKTDDSLNLYGRDFGRFEYSNKIQIHIGFDEYDEVILCDSVELTSDDEFFYDGYTILEGDITKYAWNDYKLYIYLDGIFYEFDLNAYEPPALDKNGNLRYKPNEYTKEEFENAFPDNRSEWDWYSGQ